MASSSTTKEPPSITQGPHNDTYVVHYDFSDAELGEALTEFQDLCTELTRVGLTFEVRSGEDQSLLIFVRVPELLLRRTVYKSRLKDWLYGTVNDPPPLDQRHHGIDAAFEAEDLLSVYHLVNWPESNGGAGITPEHGKWERVKSIFPLHNSPANKALLSRLSKRLFLSFSDLDQIRDLFGAKTAFYFAYMQTYFLFLFFPAVTGIYTWMFLPNYSFTYAIATLFGCTVFLEYWKIQQAELSVRWMVRGIGHVKINRSNFKYDRVTVDKETGRELHHYPKWKLVLRQALQVPFFLGSLATLGAIISMVFALEVMVSEVYEGAYKSYLEYLPTVVLAIGMPYISSFLEDMAVKLAEFENHRTQDNYEMSAGQKMFLLSFISNYMPIFITAFIYVPLGDVIVPQLQLFVRSWRSLGEGDLKPGDVFHRDPDRLRNEVVALTVTGQVSDMFEEMIMPYLKHRLRAWWRDYKARRAEQAYGGNGGAGGGGGGGGISRTNTLDHKKNLLLSDDDDDKSHKHHSTNSKNDDTTDADDFKPSKIVRSGTLMLSGDTPDEKKFLEKVRHQASLEAYNVQDDLSEMVIQFGYLALFSPAWPLVSIGFLINNWIELRSDFLKICVEQQRPHPTRADGIGSWTDSLDALALLGSICTGAIVHLFGSTGGATQIAVELGTAAAGESEHWLVNLLRYLPFSGTLLSAVGDVSSWWSLPVTIFISEHVFLVLRGAVRFLLGRMIGSDVVRRERAEQYARRQRQWEDMVAKADAEAGAPRTALDHDDPESTAATSGGNDEKSAAEAREAERHRNNSRDEGVMLIQEMKKFSMHASGMKLD
ncbi:calcium-activated chloride channel-domain-containing protein [Microdochium bolleyi]|uniref:Calcium-activated chloride channel-domain-containing protein n=1 Tax=Microdochium bolleyi TaxID=196109 RepID=A0A136J0F4_9PEZI|nr:calcium-activated chloride channel-domain-containing protein [Microdochium bolleyi]